MEALPRQQLLVATCEDTRRGDEEEGSSVRRPAAPAAAGIRGELKGTAAGSARCPPRLDRMPCMDEMVQLDRMAARFQLTPAP